MNRITLSADLHVQAADEAAPATFELVAYTGASIRQGWSRNPLVVDLAGMDAAKASIPILYAHGKELPLLDSVIGRSTEILNDGNQLVIRGELIRGEPAADKLIRYAKAGVPLQASIGADAMAIENVNAGGVVTVNGRDFSGPVSVARQSDLRETSVVLFGADGRTSAAIAAEANEGNPMSDELNQKPVEAAAPQTEAPASVAAETKAPAPIVAAKGGDGASLVDAETVANLVLQKIRAERLAEVRAERPKAPAVHVVDADATSNPKVIEAALCLAGGLPGVDKAYDAKVLEAADRRRANTSLGEVLVEAARANGYTGPSRITQGTIREVLASGFATHSISNVLSATYGKFLLQGFTAVESTWDRISSVRSVSDYKQVTGVRVTGGFEFDEVGNGGELKMAEAGDETRSIKANLYGRLSAITMVDIVNDDLGALTVVPQRLGRGASIKLNKVFWGAFEDSNATYFAKETAASGNALAISSLKTAAASYRKLKDGDGNPLGISPAMLLVPPELEITAAELMGGSLLITGENSTRTNVNVLAGRYQVVSSSYLTSGTTWWLVANPGELPAMEVAFLNGQRTPTVQQAEADFDTLGIQVRGHFSFGVAKAESKGAYRMATA
jgi:phage major head subunit gpT-like protein